MPWLELIGRAKFFQSGFVFDLKTRRTGLNEEDNRDQQLFRYIFSFTEDAFKKINEGEETEEEVAVNIMKATESEGCEAHTAGGALFWFTIMTTV